MQVQNTTGAASLLQLFGQNSVTPTTPSNAISANSAAVPTDSTESGASTNTPTGTTSSLVSPGNLFQIIQATQQSNGSTSGSASVKQSGSTSPPTAQTTPSGSDWISFPPENAPQNVVDAWNKATAGLDEQQKTLASLNAMLADGQQQLHILTNGQVQISGSNTVSPDTDWQQLSQNVVSSLQQDQRFNNAPTEQANIQALIDTFQNFQSYLG
jgi:hypothetical protein